MKKIGFGILGFCLLAALPVSASGVADSRLVNAVRGNDHVALKRLLAAKVNVNAPLPDESTVLAWAVNRQDVESVRMLLAAGAKPNSADFNGITPVTLACELGNPEIVLSLLKAGGDANATRADGISALALCAGNSSTETLEALIAKGARVDAANPEGQTALMRAAFKGRTDNIKVLLAHGANANAATTGNHFTPLFSPCGAMNRRRRWRCWMPGQAAGQRWRTAHRSLRPRSPMTMCLSPSPWCRAAPT